jgi:protein O-GlcNAc transferase
MSQRAIQQALEIAIEHHRTGQLEQAERLLRQILTQDPENATAMEHLGVICHRLGRNDVAVELLGKALSLKRSNAAAFGYFGNALCAVGRFNEAIAAFRNAIELKPDLVHAHSNLGNALHHTGQLDEALESYQKAIALKPDFAEAYSNMGNLLRDMNRLDDAIAALKQAVALKPNFPEAHNTLANVLKEKGQLQHAIASYRQAISMRPDFPEAHNNLGSALRHFGQTVQAMEACRHAIALRPNYWQAYNNLGNVLTELGKSDEALTAYRQAISIRPDFAEAWNNLGSTLKNKGQLDEAIASFRQAISLDPRYNQAHSNLVYTLHFQRGYDAHEHQLWNRQHAAPYRQSICSHANKRDSGRRLRIGYVSCDFTEHPIGRFLHPLLSHHDKSRFETFAYAQVPAPDAMTHRLRSQLDHWREIAGVSDADVADMIRADQIDILVDLTMHMAGNRMLVFSRKPAPVQVTYLAYCSSTGLETMDYRLSDPWMDPPQIARPDYTERTILLDKTYWCYEPIAPNLEIKPLPATGNGYVTFGSLNNFCKITEPVLGAWTRILSAISDSRLLIHAHEGDHRQRIRHQFQQNGIEPYRIEFASIRPLGEYFELYGRIDITLDTFPYCGGTTTCDALWMGVPVVTLAGETGVGRGGVSILSNLGLTQLIADSPELYAQIARELAGDRERLGQLRSTLRQQMQRSPLMDAPRFAASVEAAYRQMWQDWCQNPSRKLSSKSPGP